MKDTIGVTIESDVPILDKLQGITAVILRILFANKIANFLWDIVYLVTVAVIFTRELRLLADSTVISSLVIAILVVFFLMWGGTLTKFIIPKLTNVLFGSPVFGKIGGLPRKTFFTALKCKADWGHILIYDTSRYRGLLAIASVRTSPCRESQKEGIRFVQQNS